LVIGAVVEEITHVLPFARHTFISFCSFDLYGFIRFNARMDVPERILEPLPYHLELREYLKCEERALWNWFSSAQSKADYTEKLKLELLKSSYRLDAEAHPELNESVNEAKARLQLDIPVTLYQAQQRPQLNASLFYIPGEGHIVFSGPVFTLLNAEEVKCVIAHELAHYHLWARDGGEFHIVDRLVHAVANDPRSTASHEQTARRYQLYTEIFADRGSLQVIGEVNPVISSLVKMETGLTQVSAGSYLKQAEEIFANGNVATEGVSHPEAFIRARALALWKEQSPEASEKIERMIEGTATLDDLDLLGQKRVSATTRLLLGDLLRPKWFQTPATLAHAKSFFPDFQAANGTNAAPVEELKLRDGKLREYLCYVMLDFAQVDPELEEAPLAAAWKLAQQYKVDEQFEKLAVKELKMRMRDWRRIQERTAEILAKAEEASD
jgi:predicted SprT family Zn-dependent metalloprotease